MLDNISIKRRWKNNGNSSNRNNIIDSSYLINKSNKNKYHNNNNKFQLNKNMNYLKEERRTKKDNMPQNYNNSNQI